MKFDLKLLPILIIVIAFAMTMRAVEVFDGVVRIGSTAFAEESKMPPQDGLPEASEAVQTPAANPPIQISEEDEAPAETSEPVVEASPGVAEAWRDAGDSDLSMEGVKREVFQDLVKRREALDAREKGLIAREALLKAAERELDRKYQELAQLRGEIESLLDKQSEEEQERAQSLVKIYEGMKPAEAARIFNTLDLDVLLGVVSRMSARKLSPVMAQMEPERARTVTILLSEQKQLPKLPDQN